MLYSGGEALLAITILAPKLHIHFKVNWYVLYVFVRVNWLLSSSHVCIFARIDAEIETFRLVCEQ